MIFRESVTVSDESSRQIDNVQILDPGQSIHTVDGEQSKEALRRHLSGAATSLGPGPPGAINWPAATNGLVPTVAARLLVCGCTPY